MLGLASSTLLSAGSLVSSLVLTPFTDSWRIMGEHQEQIWKEDLEMGHNVILWGLGSKINVVHHFATSVWKGMVVEMDGYRPDCKLRSAVV